MRSVLFICMTAALLTLCGGQNTERKGRSLLSSGYHLCTRNQTRVVSFLVVHKVPYTESKPCDGWLPWTTCTVTLYNLIPQTEFKTVMEQVTECCDSYEQVGRYCALCECTAHHESISEFEEAVNRSGEFTAKPGSCPTADGLDPRSEGCELDIDCPGRQKCCQICDRSLCSDPASSVNYHKNGGNRFNATVTVKTDYQQLMSRDKGLLDHTRLLHAMVTGALQSEGPIYYLSSWPVHPHRTATSLLIDCDSTLPLHNVTSKLHALLKHILEVSSVTVQDVDECAHSALRQCSLQANCSNRVGSYQCVCHQGYIDVDPSNPGANCTADIGLSTTMEPPLSHVPPKNTTYTTAFNTTQDPPGMTTALSNTSLVPYNSSHTPPWTSSAQYTNMGSTGGSPPPTTTCRPPSISSLWSANVTGASFSVCWSGHSQTKQTYRVVLSKASEVVLFQETNQTSVEVRGLQPGVLYNVTVTPQACGSQGVGLRMLVKTDAQTLDATARLTNIQFIADLRNTSSQAYKNLTETIKEEINQSLTLEIRAMVDSGRVRIEIRSFSLGSVVVNFSIISIPNQSQDISNVSTALLHSLMNSSKLTVDKNNTSINDFNECTSGESDCSQWANCTNTWASYTCVCLDGFIDNNPERPGRTCQAITPAPRTALYSTVSTTTVSQITTSSSDPAVTTGTTTPLMTMVNISTSQMVPTTEPFIAASTTAPTTATPTTTTTEPTTTSTTEPTTTTTTEPSTTTTGPTTTSTTEPTTTTTTEPSTTTTGPTTSSTAEPTTTTTTEPTTTTTKPTTTSTTEPTTTTTTEPTTSSTAEATTTTTTEPTTTSTTEPTPTTTTEPTTTSTTEPTTPTTTEPTTTTTEPTTTSTTEPTTTSTTEPTTTTTTKPTTPTTTEPTTTTTTTEPTTTTTTSTTTTKPSTTTTTSTTTTKPTTTTTTPTSLSTTASSTAINTTTTTMKSAINSSMLGALSVQCRVAAITVTIAKDFLLSSKIQESGLYLGLVGCGVNGDNATHVQLTVAWNECATRLVQNVTHYTASVTLLNSMDPYTAPSGAVEIPRILLEVPIMCTYMKSMLISADFGSMGYDTIKDVIVGLGSFQVMVQLMNGTEPLPHNYSISSDQAVVVEVSLNTSSEHIKVVINKCWATPTQNPGDTYSYTFLESSCSLNTYTRVLMNGNSSTSRVSVQIFSFVNLDVIYLHCQVQICLQVGSDTCVPDCLQRTARSTKTIGSGFGTSGPVRRLLEESFEEELNILQIVGFSCLGVGLSVFFIIGFVCLFFYQRNRIGHYNFNVKPKEENFTYLVFNT